MGRLTGRGVIVTGSAQGIGEAFAKALAAEGARVSLCDVNPTDQVVKEICSTGAEAIGHICDVSDPAAVGEMVRKTAAAFGNIQVLINNAAISGDIKPKPLTEISSAEWDRMMAVNARGPFECVKAVVPLMEKQRYGKIVNLASGMVFKGSPHMLHYASSKGAIISMTRCIARELGPKGIRCNCLAPGLTMSPTVIANPALLGPHVGQRCLARDEVPEDIVGTIVFLASAESDFITGQTIVVDGGSAMH